MKQSNHCPNIGTAKFHQTTWSQEQFISEAEQLEMSHNEEWRGNLI
jgi:hypothetical protein